MYWSVYPLTVPIFLFSAPGKKRLWVITAPSHSDNYLRMMEKQLEDMEQVLKSIYSVDTYSILI